MRVRACCLPSQGDIVAAANVAMRWLARVDEDDDVWNALATNRGRAALSPTVTPLLAFEQAVLVRRGPVLW